MNHYAKHYRRMIVALQDEIEWCGSNPDKSLSKEFRRGFVKGLKQAQFVVRAAMKVAKLEAKDGGVVRERA